MTDDTPTTVRVYMALDPETLRVLFQEREFADGDFPRGLRGLDWPKREAEIPAEDWKQLLAGGLPPDEQDQLHREVWSENGDTPWPTL